MNIQMKLEQFRDDNPYNSETQAKRLLASNDTELILYVLALGLQTAKQRERHQQREYIKNVGETPPRQRVTPGRVTGSVKITPIKPSKKTTDALKELIADVWMVGDKQLGDCTEEDLSNAIKRENASSIGHAKNKALYVSLKKPLDGTQQCIRMKWNEKDIRQEIEKIYGEFRRGEAA